eukprot:SAG31_NODE_810_length_11919_cov_4.480924_7_plen_264_part_00
MVTNAHGNENLFVDQVTQLVDDMQAQIDAELAARDAHPLPPLGNASSLAALEASRPEFYAAFRNIGEIEERIDILVAAAPPGLLVERFVYGTTHLGHDMIGLRMKSRSAGAAPKFWQHGVQHGGESCALPGCHLAADKLAQDWESQCRLHAQCHTVGEWITAMVCMYLAETLVADYDSEPISQYRLLDNMEFIFAPVVNVGVTNLSKGSNSVVTALEMRAVRCLINSRYNIAFVDRWMVSCTRGQTQRLATGARADRCIRPTK